MLPKVEIRGDSIAAQACCALLRRFGWDVNTPQYGSPQVPYIVINSVTAGLIKDIFAVNACSLGSYEISRRLVVTHSTEAISTVIEPALLIHSAAALRFLGAAAPISPSAYQDSAWRLFAGEHPPQGQLVYSGNRAAWVFEASRCSEVAFRTAIFEFIPEGWLFWAPLDARKGFLQLVLPRTQEDVTETCRLALKHTRILKHAIALGGCSAGPLPAAAALHSHLTGPGWIATGASALRYDPVSGDGTGASLRSAILACATLRACVTESDPRSYLEHYKQRLILAFQRHLMNCALLYENVGLSGIWTPEINDIRQLGSARPEESKAFRFCLRDYSLAPLEARETGQAPEHARA